MDFKEALLLTKEFSNNSNSVTPQLASDWTFNIIPMYSRPDKVSISSEILGYTIELQIEIYTFLKKYIFSKEILIDGNHLIGAYSFSKTGLVDEQLFLDAQNIVSENTFDIIENDELMDYNIYIDTKGDKYVYFGHYA